MPIKADPTAAERDANWRRRLRQATGPRRQEAVPLPNSADQRKTIMTALALANKPMGPSEIASATEMENGAVRFLLHAMVKSGDVAKVSHGRYSTR